MFILCILIYSSISFVRLLLRANHRRAHGLELVFDWLSVKDEQKNLNELTNRYDRLITFTGIILLNCKYLLIKHKIYGIEVNIPPNVFGYKELCIISVQSVLVCRALDKQKVDYKKPMKCTTISIST